MNEYVKVIEEPVYATQVPDGPSMMSAVAESFREGLFTVRGEYRPDNQDFDFYIECDTLGWKARPGQWIVNYGLKSRIEVVTDEEFRKSFRIRNAEAR